MSENKVCPDCKNDLVYYPDYGVYRCPNVSCRKAFYDCLSCGQLYENLHQCPTTTGLKVDPTTDNIRLADPVNHPKHYTSHPSGIEIIQITRHMSFNLGNAVKYVCRADHKKDAIQDLNKAIWYIIDEIQKRGGTVTVDSKEKHK